MLNLRSCDQSRESVDRNSKRYLWRVFFGVFLLLFLISFFNFIIDPLGLFRIVTLPGINNDRRPALEIGHRLIREVEIIIKRPDTLILGTSRELYGIEPVAIPDRQHGRVHNASIAAATIGDIEKLVSGAAAIAKVRQIYIGLDYFSFDDRRAPVFQGSSDAVEVLSRSFLLIGQSVMSLSAARQSIETIIASRCRPDGEEYPPGGYRVLDIAIAPCGAPRQPLPTPEQASRAVTLFNFDSRIGALASFERILRHCVAEAIDCKPFVGPMHGVYLTALREVDWSRFQSWKLDLARLSDRYGIAVYDFSSAFAASVSPLAQQPDRFYDTLHYGTKVGVLIIDVLNSDQRFSFRLQAEPERLSEILVRDVAAIAAYRDNDYAFATALTQAIRSRSDALGRE